MKTNRERADEIVWQLSQEDRDTPSLTEIIERTLNEAEKRGCIRGYEEFKELAFIEGQKKMRERAATAMIEQWPGSPTWKLLARDMATLISALPIDGEKK